MQEQTNISLPSTSVFIPDFSKLTVTQIKEYSKANNLKVPSGLKKDDLVKWIQGVYSERLSGIIKKDQPETFPIEAIQPKYQDSKMDWLPHLYQYGWAVAPIPGWNPNFINMFLSFLESCCSNFKKEDASTWKPENLPILSRGILKHYMGHIEMQWQIRELCATLFARMWACNPEDLLSSFDGGCFLMGDLNIKTDTKNWIHVDTPRNQYGIYNFSCVQGIVNFLDNGPNDGGLVLVEGSQHILKEYMDKHLSEGIIWQIADMNDPLLSTKQMIKICAKAGEMIMFDSRIFHCNMPPIGNNLRICTYVSMQLRVGAKEEELIKRCKLYEQGRMTGHWCYGSFFKETSKDPNTYGKPNNKPSVIEIAPLNPLRKKLIGY